MKTKYAFLQRSLELFEEEPWKEPHRQVMARHDKAELLDQQSEVMMAVYDSLERSSHAHSKPPQTLTSCDAQMLCKLWIDWYDKAKVMLSEIKGLEEDTYRVPAAEKLRSSFGKANGWIDSVRKLAASLEEIAQDDYLTLDEMLDAIRI